MNIQFKAIASEFFEMPLDYVVPSKLLPKIEKWQDAVNDQIVSSRLGYAQTTVFRTPVLEDQLMALMLPELGNSRLKAKRPTICLTHDLDYLKATPQMNIKRIVATRKLQWKNESYFSSIKTLVDLDLAVAKSSTFFVASPKVLPLGFRRVQQWLLDPSYKFADSEFIDVVHLFNENNVDIGIHGSFFSHKDSTLKEEVKNLSLLFKKSIIAGRQHWLNLPNPHEDLQRLYESGLRIDTTLGWNGNVGFRGGLARPFPVQTKAGTILLLPMLLMDGTLFDDLKLTKSEALQLSTQLLEEVFRRNGTVSIDWHERSAHKSYDWFGVYEEIVTWAAKKGFDFRSVSELVPKKDTHAISTIS